MGEVKISGSKNAALPIMAASLLSPYKISVSNIPDIADTRKMFEIMKDLGGNVIFTEGTLTNSQSSLDTKIEYLQDSGIRGSILLLGPLLTLVKEIELSMPGGCKIGDRTIDFHLEGFKKMGVTVVEKNGSILLQNPGMNGCSIELPFPSVGATENLLMAATAAKGETVIVNAAMEPEITDLANFLNFMGYDISGAGTSTIRIGGSRKEHVDRRCYSVIPDRIEAGTFIALAGITNGCITLRGMVSEHLEIFISTLARSGLEIEETQDGLQVTSVEKMNAANIKTGPYPGFPTDLQPIFASLMTKAQGRSNINESIFNNRFEYVKGLVSMGAKCDIDGNQLTISGPVKLHGAQVSMPDLRGGAALLLAAFSASGTSELYDNYHVKRGYEDLVKKMSNLGLQIEEADSH